MHKRLSFDRHGGRRLRGIALASAFVCLMFPIQLLSAATFNVPAGDVQALIDAINDANANNEADTIVLQAGTYLLTEVDNNAFFNGENGLPSITSVITLRGESAAATRILRNDQSPIFRILHVAASGHLKLERLTIAGGATEGNPGSGILNLGSLDLKLCTIRDNLDDGGGVANRGSLNMTRCSVHNNSADDGDGAGGVFNEDGRVAITRSVIRDNTGFEAPGGIWNDNGTFKLSRTTVQGNRSDSTAGILNQGSMHIDRSTISGNVSDTFGPGGIDNSGQLNLDNSTVSGNRTGDEEGTGGISNRGRLKLRNATVTANEGFQPEDDFPKSGGILALRGSVTIEQSIVAGNTLRDGPASDCVGSITSRKFNLVGEGTGCPSNRRGDQTVSPDQVFTTVLGPLQGNGGPTETHSLLSGSPAIDAIKKSSCRFRHDQRGKKRPQDGNDDGVKACDVGAVEVRASEVAVSSCVQQFGDAPGFNFCGETATTCRFSATTRGTCEAMCNSLGSRCVGALDNHGNSCDAIAGSRDTCQTRRQTEICICEQL